MPRETQYRPPTRFSVMPPVIKNLLVINGLFFIAQFVAIQTLAESAILGQVLNYLALYPWGAPEQGFAITTGRALVEVPGFLPWQIVSYSFLHGSFGHLFFNMFALWMFGVQVENRWGSQRFGVFYFVCVIGAAFTHMLFTPMLLSGGPEVAVPTVGASGGVYGVLLAFGMMFPNRPIYIWFLFPIKAKWLVMGFGALELYSAVTGTQGGVANFAHLGGMVVGFLLIQYWRGKLPMEPDRVMRW